MYYGGVCCCVGVCYYDGFCVGCCVGVHPVDLGVPEFANLPLLLRAAGFRQDFEVQITHEIESYLVPLLHDHVAAQVPEEQQEHVVDGEVFEVEPFLKEAVEKIE